MFQANTESRSARSNTMAEFVGLLTATFAAIVFAFVIFKILQSQFEQTRTVYLGDGIKSEMNLLDHRNVDSNKWE